MTEVRFTSDLIKTDVTALKVLKNDILSIGIGNVIYLYNVINQKFISKTSIFIGQNIHGIIPDESNKTIIVYGGKEAKIYTLSIEVTQGEINANLIFMNKHLKCSDWIIKLIWIKGETEIAVLTAHNVVQIWNLATISLMTTHQCFEKCILYSGLLAKLNNSVLIMAGTAFSQVLIWSTDSERVLHRITGHKGVIFSVSYDKKTGTIVTTSDDRSVRIWKLSLDNNYSLDTIEYWQHVSIECEGTLFGHTARVVGNVIQDRRIYSIGEDGIVCLWALNGKLLNKKRVTQNGGLWCLDYHRAQDAIITGGSNCEVILHTGFCNSDLPDIIALDMLKHTIVKKIALTARGHIVCIIENGDIMYYDSEMDEWTKKHQIAYSKSYFCMAVSPCRQFIAFGGDTGHIDVFAEPCKYIPNLKHLLSQKILNCKIMSIHWVINRKLIVCDKNGEITVWGHQNENCVKVSTYSLPKCKERWLTAAALEPSKRQYLLVGDRCGNLHLFKSDESSALETLSKVHGRLGINTIQFHENKIVTSGRDGSIKYFILLEDNEKRLQYINHIKLPFEWVECFIDKNKSIICGFQETDLIVWDTKECNYIYKVNCGGGHRSWDVTLDWYEYENKVQKILRCAFVKNSVVYVVNGKYDNIKLKSFIKGIHSKEINDVKSILCSLESDRYYLISAGEDTTVQIALCESQQNVMEYKEICNMTNHLSCVRCMLLLPCTDFTVDEQNHKEYYLYSAGGRAQICISKIILNGSRIDCHELYNYLLKGTDYERKKRNNIFENIDTRFMSLHCVGKNKNILLAGCSDGVLRVFKAITEQNKFSIRLVHSLKYHKRCILKVGSFEICNKLIVLTFAVDGSIAFWNFTEFMNQSQQVTIDVIPFDKLYIHKAGINSYDLNPIDDDSIILATGGDDNVLNLNIFNFKNFDDKLTVNKVCGWSSEKYHCSQITGLKILKTHIVSASIDQRITIGKWLYDENSSSILCEFIGQYHTSIPDIQGLEIIKCDSSKISLCVHGKGIQCITIDL